MPGRRSVLIAFALSLLALVSPASVAQTGRAYVIGLLFTSAGAHDPLLGSIRKGLEDLGYKEGRDFRFEYRGAGGQIDRLPRLADELAQIKADVIVVATEAALLAAKNATNTTPIVANLFDYDPVASGLIDSLAHPGSNVTGIFTRAPELIGKRIELLKEALPGLSRVSVFYDSYGQRQLQDAQTASHSLGIESIPIELRSPYDYGAAIRVARQRRAGAGIFLYSPAFWVARDSIAQEAIESRLPVIGYASEFARAGFFASYGTDAMQSFRRLAYFIDKVLKGVDPKNLPVEQPTKFEMVVNLKTAKALGLTVGQSTLLRADEVIR